MSSLEWWYAKRETWPHLSLPIGFEPVPMFDRFSYESLIPVIIGDEFVQVVVCCGPEAPLPDNPNPIVFDW